MQWPCRADGPDVLSNVQVPLPAPFHSHVSFPPVSPPKSKVVPRCASKVIAGKPRGAGPVAVRKAQVDPFHSQVAPEDVPPNRTVTPRTGSYAMAWPKRDEGPVNDRSDH